MFFVLQPYAFLAHNIHITDINNSEYNNHLEEVATAVGQRKQGAWTKWESAKDRAVTWRDLKHMEPKKLSFLIKAVYDVLPTPINLHAWRLTTSDRCGKTANLKHILTGCEYALRSYIWRHNEVLEVFAEVSKICCETANKALNIINNRAIQFVKEGNISKLARKNIRKPSLLEGCTAWHVATDLNHNFVFPTEIAGLIALAAAVVWKKQLSMPSTTANEFVRSGITSGSGRRASNPSSSCCSTLVTS